MAPALVWSARTYAPLTFGGITDTETTPTSVNVSWQPSAPAQGQVVYGTTAGGPYPFSTTLETNYLSDHTQAITGLSTGVTYYARVWGLTADGRSAYSDEFDFATATAAAFDDGMTYTSSVAWPTGTGWTAGALSTIRANINALVAASGSGASLTSNVRHLPAAGAVYPIDTYINLRPGGVPLQYVTFEFGGTEASTEPWGHTGGATISTIVTTAGNTAERQVFTGGSSSGVTYNGIRWHAGTLKGSAVNLASSTAGSQASEKQHGIGGFGATNCLVDHMVMTDFMGDNIYLAESLNSNGVSSGVWCDGWELRYNQFLRAGRQGLAPGQGARNVNIHHNYFADPAYCYIDWEGNYNYQGAENVAMDDNVFGGKWAWMQTGGPDGLGLATPCIFFTNFRSGGFYSGYIRIRRNRVDGIEASPYYTATTPKFVVKPPWNDVQLRGEVTITDNVKTSAKRAGPIVIADRTINGPLVVRNNTGWWTGSGSWLQANGSVTPDQGGNT